MGKVVKIVAGLALIAIGALVATVNPFIGRLIISLGVTLVLQGVLQVILGTPSGTRPEIANVNVRISEPIRWLSAGRTRQGGGVLFSEFDNKGDLWYLIVHNDAILTNTVNYYLDDIPVTLDGAGNVLTKEFRLTNKFEAVETDGAGDAFVTIYTSTYSETNVIPPAITALQTAFPSKWTTDHKLVGTTYSVVRMKTLKPEDRFKLYKFRGPLGLGEPSLSIVGEWSHCYDPRAIGQLVNDATTHTFSRNPALVWAWFRTHRYGRNKSRDSINWIKIAEQANICDQNVTGIAGTQKRYQCDINSPEDKRRIESEQEILLSMDAQLVFDDDGKCWPRAGYYETPTLLLNRNRDIMAMESIEAQDGESETQGVVVRFTDPEAKYTIQPAAPWYNPLYYNEGEAATFLNIDIPTITNHNQAMRIAKAIGMRSQPLHKIAPTVSLRGLKARSERLINLNYDNTFSGDYEIISQVEVDPVGVMCGFALTPATPFNWSLLPGEEKPKPVIDDIEGVAAPTLPTSVSVTFINGRIQATFTAALRNDLGYEFEYIPSADLASDIWESMTVNNFNGIATSQPLTLTTEYLVRYRSVSASGRVSAWSSNVVINGTSVISDSVSQAIFNSWIVEVAAGTPIVAVDATGQLTITTHTRRYPDGFADKSVTGASIATGLAAGVTRSIAYDDPTRAGGAVTYNLYTNNNDAHVSSTNLYRHFVGFFTVPATGSSNGGGGGIPGRQIP